MDKKPTVIVTGSSGFLGNSLCNFLEKDFRIVRIDSKGENAAKLDLLKKNSWGKIGRFAKSTKTFLIHLAFIQNNENLEKDNLQILHWLLRFMDKYKQAYLLFPSSALVYGTHNSSSVNEESPANPDSDYSRLKLSMEKAIQKFCPERSVIFRITNIYGSSAKENTVIAKIIGQIKQNKKIELEDYNSIRDFVHIDSVNEAFKLMILHILEHEKDSKNLESPFSIFNVSTGKGTSIYGVAHEIARLYNKLELLPDRKIAISRGKNECLVLSPKKLEMRINAILAHRLKKKQRYKPINIKEGLKRMIKY